VARAEWRFYGTLRERINFRFVVCACGCGKADKGANETSYPICIMWIHLTK
jgi:hypothetical protein